MPDREGRLALDESATGLVEQGLHVVLRRRLVDQHYARAPKVEYALHLLDGPPEDFAHVHRGADQRGELTDDGKPRRRGARAPRCGRGTIGARGAV